MDIKPIETRYKGYRFRSRLEARWAVFFDALGVKWEYEPEGYDLGEAGWYLPDFWLPEMGIWAEVKGRDASVDEQYKAYKLSALSKKGVLMIQGSPGLERLDFEYTKSSSKNILYCGECFDVYDLPCCFPSHCLSLRQMLCGKTQYITLDELQSKKFTVNDEESRRSHLIELDKLYFLRHKGKPHPKYAMGRTVDHLEWRVDLTGKIRLTGYCGYVRLDYLGQRVIDAHSAARSARFEHGESGAK
jgi:hypothetical protein